MAEKLDWKLQFDLVGDGLQKAKSEMDKLQGSLKAGQKAMLELEVGGKKVNVELTGAAQKADKLADSASKLGSVVSGVGTAFGVLAGGIAGAVKALDAFGDRAIAKFGERMGTLRAYTTLLGDATAAEREYGKARGLAATTDLTAKDTVAAQKALMVAGFRGGDLDRALLAVTDLSAMAAPEERTMMMERSGRALAQIRAKGKLQGEELRQLSEAGLGRGLVLEELGKMGVKGDVEKAISGGKVSSEMGIAAIQKAILAQFGTSKLGEYATGAGGTLSGLLSNRDEAVDNLLTSIDSEVLPAMGRYKASLKAQVEQLDVNSEAGQQTAVTLQDLANTSIGMKTAWTDFITGFVDSFTKSYNKTMAAIGINKEAMASTADAAKQMGETLGKVGEAVGAIVRVFDYLGKVISPIASGIEGFGIILGAIGEMLADIMAGDWGEVKNDYYRMRDKFWGKGEYAPRGTSAAQRDAAAMAAFGDDSGAGTGGGGGGGYNPLGVQLKNFGNAKKKGAGGGGKGGGGLGSVGGDFRPDYSDLSGGVALPSISVPGAVPTMSYATTPYAADQAAAVSATLQRQKLELEWSGDMYIDGSDDPGAVADEVEARLLRKFGRYTRAPRAQVT